STSRFGRRVAVAMKARRFTNRAESRTTAPPNVRAPGQRGITSQCSGPRRRVNFLWFGKPARRRLGHRSALRYPSQESVRIEIETSPSEQTLTAVREGMRRDTESHVPWAEYSDFALIARDDCGT